MFKLSHPNLQAQLKALGYDPKVQDETNQAYLVIKHEKREFPIFFRILHEGELLQILSFIPTNFKDESLSDLCRFLLMLNKELDMPGFCIDEASKTIFYRLMLPTHNKELPKETLEAFLQTSQTVCRTFTPVIEAIAIGAMSLDEVLQKAAELKK